MITDAILTILVNGFVVMLSWLPSVSTLPTIGGYDIDGTLVSGVGATYAFANVVWPIYDVLIAASFIWGFHLLMLFLKALIGHRAPNAGDH